MSTELSTTRTLEVIAGEIDFYRDNLRKVTLSTAIEVGRRLTEAKGMCKHGEWGMWLKERFGYSTSHANDLMRIFEGYGADQMGLFGGNVKCQTFGNLDYSKALALLTVPEDEREEFTQEVDAEHISVRELKTAIRERDEARKEAEQAKANAALSREAAEKREKELSLSRELISGLKTEKQLLADQVKELEARPVEVAVQTVDASPEQIAEAERKGREAAGAEAAKEKENLRAELDEARNQAAGWELKYQQAAEAQAQVDSLRRQLTEAEQKLAQAEQEVSRPQSTVLPDRLMMELNLVFRQMQSENNRAKELIAQMDDVTRARVEPARQQILAKMME